LTATERVLLIGPIVVFAALTFVIGIWAQPFLDLATRASGELLERTPYIDAVMGVRP
jgi:multicomponent Na+:H+ antiporter subunit D